MSFVLLYLLLFDILAPERDGIIIAILLPSFSYVFIVMLLFVLVSWLSNTLSLLLLLL